ncbi:alpha-L-glutamate ligase-like protein [Succinatimonas hippei]|uniref:alpha-L-glutamate ligase-like protein n=1 Tax=Succinatimonas hippei TaxID=626938 RepID=UPI0026EF47AF|nr:alpha-L-glutamate ligase-like protein [Succinatimonas hippei]
MMIIKNLLRPITERYTNPMNLINFGIMGMNQRNVNYIGRYNKRNLYPLVDNKLKTKEIALKNGITTPKLLGVIRNQHDVQNIVEIIGKHKEFCIKPAQGSGGKGILVITSSTGKSFTKASGQTINAHDLRRHASNILAGLFSLGGKQDIALIEDLIHFDSVFDGYSYEGVPDTRVIVFQGFPIMCMMRLSTAASDGKANLHQGAVGVGICVRTGRAVRGVQHNDPIEYHPDTHKDLFKLRVPHWDEVLRLASSCYEMSGLGYIGTDIVLDRDKGPMLLELNARPGLAIQIANNAGLLPRLRLIEALPNAKSMSVDEKVEFARQHFGVFSH